MPKSIKKTRRIYLDYAAGIEANPSSIHTEGVIARAGLQKARKEIADALSARPGEIIFTSGGTESNNLAIQGAVFAWQGEVLPHIVTTNIEHPSVLETFNLLAQRKFVEISIVGVEKNGIVDSKKIKKEIKKNTALVSVNYANNEIGTIQPIKEIAKEIRHWKKNEKILLFPLFHTDAVQAGNYLDLNVKKLGVDLLSLSGSKIEGAGKAGMLYKKKSVPLAPIFGGGNQEFGLRPGTENLREILKFSRALQSTQKTKEKEAKHLTKLRDYFLEQLQKMSRGILDTQLVVNGDLKNRLPNNLNITIPNIPGDLLVIELSARGIMVSAKSACKTGDGKVSYVIKAIRPEVDLETDGSLRFSLGRQTTKAEIDYVIEALFEILTKLKKWY